MGEWMWFLAVAPLLALAQVFAGVLAAVGVTALVGAGLQAWMRADDPGRYR